MEALATAWRTSGKGRKVCLGVSGVGEWAGGRGEQQRAGSDSRVTPPNGPKSSSITSSRPRGEGELVLTGVGGAGAEM